MSDVRVEVRRGAYYDSIVLMQLQAALAALPGVDDAGVMMGTEANKAVLAGSGLLPPEAEAGRPDDLLIVVRGPQADAALGQVTALLSRRATATEGSAYRPRTLAAAAKMLPQAQWVLVSVPGRYAAAIAREALALGRNVFLYSDNVSVEEEVALKEEAARRGLLLMGPDCGTAIVGGTGLGFANRVRRGAIGLVAASGTGLQAVSAAIHRLGGGLSHGLGTGGRDLSAAVGARTARQALRLLAEDEATKVIVLISKPPNPAVAAALLDDARASGKAVVVNFVGYETALREVGPLHFAATFDEAASLAVTLSGASAPPSTPRAGFLRGLFSGGTLAYEATLMLGSVLGNVWSNAALDERWALADPTRSREHTIVDLGADEFTVGRLHPMLDPDGRLRRLRQEATDPEVALILLDVVLGDGAHPDPAAALAPAIVEALRDAAAAGRTLEIVAMVIGTDEDPQGLESQVGRLRESGAWVTTSSAEAVRHAAARLRPPATPRAGGAAGTALQGPLAAINVGLELFAESLAAQGVEALHVEWRPPAGGNERLAALLERMRGQQENDATTATVRRGDGEH